MKWATIFIGVMVLMAGGCSSEIKPLPNTSGLRVKVAAEPKKGLESSHVAVYDSGTTDVGHGAFERVDYSDLGDVVVWLEPVGKFGTGPGSFLPTAIDLDPAHRGSGLTAVALVGPAGLTFRNVSDHPVEAYSVSDGNEFNLGTIAPGQQAGAATRSEGLIEVLTDSSPEPIARIYAAKGIAVRLTHSGATLDFNNLAPGTYRVHSWHPRLPGSTVDVRLAPDQAKTVTIDVTVNGLPKVDAK